MSEEKKLVPKLRFPEFRGTAGWEDQSVGQYLEDCSGRVPPDTELPVYSSTREGLKRQDAYFDGQVLQNKNEYGVVPPACFVYRHMSDDGLFKFNINETGGDIAVSKEYPVFRTRGVNPVFLLAKLNDGPDFKRFALSQKAGGTRTRLYFSRLCEWRTPLPLSTEQQKIADCLSSLDELIAAQARKVDALKTHKKGLMQQLFPREGETQPRLRFPESRDAGEWVHEPLGELGEVITGKTPSTKESELWGGDILFITPTDISEDEKYQQATARKVVETKSTKVLPTGSIVYTCIASIGKMALTVGPSITNQQINAVVPNKKTAGEFIYYALLNLTPWIKTIPASSTLPIINKTEFSKIVIGYSEDKDEQQRIAACLTSLDTLITTATQELETLKTHKKGLMQQLFPSAEAVQA